MVQLNHTVNADNAAQAGFGLIPDGEYDAEIIACTVKQSKSNPANSYLEIELKLPGGRIWDVLNLWHSTSDKAREIAWRTLDAIGVSTGLAAIADTDQLVARRVRVRVSTEPAQGQFKAKNKIDAYLPPAAMTPVAAAAYAPPPQPSTAAPAQPAPPWASA